jgi:DNA-directed RNA polymerase specialized sigma24 family protein
VESDEITKELSRKIDTVIRLLAMEVVRGRDLRDQIKLLDQAGLKPAEIADVLGKTPNSIRVALFGIRKARGRELSAKEEER